MSYSVAVARVAVARARRPMAHRRALWRVEDGVVALVVGGRHWRRRADGRRRRGRLSQRRQRLQVWTRPVATESLGRVQLPVGRGRGIICPGLAEHTRGGWLHRADVEEVGGRGQCRPLVPSNELLRFVSFLDAAAVDDERHGRHHRQRQHRGGDSDGKFLDRIALPRCWW